MPRSLRTLSLPLIILSGLLCGWSAARVLAPAPRAPERPRYVPTRKAYDSTVVYIRTQLSRAEVERLAPVAAPQRDHWLVVLIGRGDLVSCEDLGRQLRELQRRTANGQKLVVWTVDSQREPVRRYLRREKVNAGIVTSPSLPSLGHSTATTPAALRVAAGTALAEGVAHSKRFPNLRARSFADELNDLALYRR